MNRSTSTYLLGLAAALFLVAWWLSGHHPTDSFQSANGLSPPNSTELPREREDRAESTVFSSESKGAAGAIDQEVTATTGTAKTASTLSGLHELRRRIAEAYALPAESQFLTDDRVSAAKLKPLFQGEGFDLAVDQLQQQSLLDPLAHELDSAYRQAIEQQISGNDGGLGFDQFACGLRICIGSMRSAENSDAWSRWSEAFDLDPSTPHQIFADFTSSDGAGGLSHRFLFSTDQDIQAVIDSIHR